MPFQANINWEEARRRFRHFLSRKLEIDESSVQIQGIVFGNDIWYIADATPALIKALGTFENKPTDNTLWTAVALLVGAIGLAYFNIRR